MVGSPDIAKPLPVWMDPSLRLVSWLLLHLLVVWLGLVHVDSVDGGAGTELRARFAASWVRSVRVGTCFGLLEGGAFVARARRSLLVHES